MGHVWISILLVVVGLVVGFVASLIVNSMKESSVSKKAEDMINQAKKEIEKMKRDAAIEQKEEAHKLKMDLDKEIREKKEELKVKIDYCNVKQALISVMRCIKNVKQL